MTCWTTRWQCNLQQTPITHKLSLPTFVVLDTVLPPGGLEHILPEEQNIFYLYYWAYLRTFLDYRLDNYTFIKVQIGNISMRVTCIDLNRSHHKLRTIGIANCILEPRGSAINYLQISHLCLYSEPECTNDNIAYDKSIMIMYMKNKS